MNLRGPTGSTVHLGRKPRPGLSSVPVYVLNGGRPGQGRQQPRAFQTLFLQARGEEGPQDPCFRVCAKQIHFPLVGRAGGVISGLPHEESGPPGMPTFVAGDSGVAFISGCQLKLRGLTGPHQGGEPLAPEGPLLPPLPSLPFEVVSSSSCQYSCWFRGDLPGLLGLSSFWESPFVSILGTVHFPAGAGISQAEEGQSLGDMAAAWGVPGQLGGTAVPIICTAQQTEVRELVACSPWQLGCAICLCVERCQAPLQPTSRSDQPGHLAFHSGDCLGGGISCSICYCCGGGHPSLLLLTPGVCPQRRARKSGPGGQEGSGAGCPLVHSDTRSCPLTPAAAFDMTAKSGSSNGDPKTCKE